MGNVRVIAGSAKGRRLETLKDGEIMRPTTNKVKEAVFSSIQFEIEGSDFLDVFCGCGQMGIEALSRGARSAVFIDASRKSVECTKRNLEVTKLIQFSEIIHSNSIKYLQNTKKMFDIAYLDPPFETGVLQEVLPLVAQIMNTTGIIICERAKNDKILQKYYKFTLDREYSYGKICISVYRNNDDSDTFQVQNIEEG